MVVLHVCVLSEGSWSSLTLNGKLSVNRRGASLKKNNHDLWLFFETKLISKCWTWNPYNLCQLNQCRGGGGGGLNQWLKNPSDYSLQLVNYFILMQATIIQYNGIKNVWPLNTFQHGKTFKHENWFIQIIIILQL